MLYQLGNTIGGIIIIVDCIVVGLLVYLIRKPRDIYYKWWTITAVILLALPLSAFKLLRSSNGTSASTPGLVTVSNPEQDMVKLYYIRHLPTGTRQIVWVAYMLRSDKETVLETEGQFTLEVAYQQAGQWRYAPISFNGDYQTSLSFPQDFATVDTSGQIEAAVNQHILVECITWLSHLLTLCSIGLLAALIIRFIRRLMTPNRLSTAT